jgi:hypothetical protein
MTEETDDHASPSSVTDGGKAILLGGPVLGAPISAAEEKPAASQPAAPEPAAPQPAARERRSVIMPALGVLGFLILAVAIGYLWVRPETLPAPPVLPPDESGAVSALQADVATLKTQLAALDQRETADVAALHATIAALPAPTASAPSAAPTSAPAVAEAAPDTALAAQVAGLADRLNQIQAAEVAQAQQAQALPSANDLSNLSARVDAIAQRESKDGDSIRQDLTLVQQQLAILSGQAQSLSKSAGALPQLTAEAGRLSAIVRAEAALRAGLPLGTIPNAPAALTRFADSAPPTEAALRLSFTDAAKAADKAGEPPPDKGSFWHRVWLRAQTLIMVRQGDRVVLGDPTSGVLAQAQTVLDAGDLAGALTVLGTLTGPAASAMAPWEAQAQSLLAARQALAQMAAG